jgi:hypothetical protein
MLLQIEALCRHLPKLRFKLQAFSEEKVGIVFGVLRNCIFFAKDFAKLVLVI